MHSVTVVGISLWCIEMNRFQTSKPATPVRLWGVTTAKSQPLNRVNRSNYSTCTMPSCKGLFSLATISAENNRLSVPHSAIFSSNFSCSFFGGQPKRLLNREGEMVSMKKKNRNKSSLYDFWRGADAVSHVHHVRCKFLSYCLLVCIN